MGRLTPASAADAAPQSARATMTASAIYYTGARGSDVQCEGITAAGAQCRCRAVGEINHVPYCRQHIAKELRAVAGKKSTPTV